MFLKNSTYYDELLDFLYTYIFLDSFLIDCSVGNLFFLLVYKLFSCSFSNSLKLSYTRKKPWKFICPLTHFFSNDWPCKRQEVLDHELFTDSNSRNNLQRGMAGKGWNGLSGPESNNTYLMINIMNYIHKSLNLKGMFYLQGSFIDLISFNDPYILFQLCWNFLRPFLQIN